MSEDLGALCSDFYVNQRLQLKMDLPQARESVLELFDRVRREFPDMEHFRKTKTELVLESPNEDGRQHWLSLRKNNLRTGVANPEKPKQAYALHKFALEVAPYFLSISPLDLDYLELLYGFDLLADNNHDQIVFDALIDGSPLANLYKVKGASPIDVQPVLGLSLTESGDLQAHYEIRTRTADRLGQKGDFPPEPISVYLVIRKHGPIRDVKDLPKLFTEMTGRAEDLLENKVIPGILVPLRDTIGPSRG